MSEGSHTVPEYKSITVSGPVSIEPRSKVVNPTTLTVLIMGPTGAGKSCFIEALGGSKRLRISSNRLEGFTQKMTAYEINNVRRDEHPLYLIDSPGFADTKISERAIVSMVTQWLKDNNEKVYSRVLYLTPIRPARLSGSQRQVLNTFKALTGSNTAKNITIVTTMWDTIWGDRAAECAQSTFIQLRDQIWKDFIDEGARMVMFTNTQESALAILDESLTTSINLNFPMEDHDHIATSPFAANIYNDLKGRIESLQLQKLNIVDSLIETASEGDEVLQATLILQLAEAITYLAKFEQELRDFNLPPKHKSDSAASLVRSSIDGPIFRGEPNVLSLHSVEASRKVPGRVTRALHSLNLKCCGGRIDQYDS